MRYVEALNGALHRMMAADGTVVVIGEDVLDPYGGAFKVTKGLSTAFPGRVFTTPISESGLVGTALGMALRGLKPVAEIMFGDFVTLATDQLVNHAAKFPAMYGHRMAVPLVVRTPMGGYRGYGPTHSQSLESLFMAVPGLHIVAASLAHDPGLLLERAVLEDDGPVLFVENKLLYPQELVGGGTPDGLVAETVSPGRRYPTMRLSMVPGEAPDVTLITYGGVTRLAMAAAVEAMMEAEMKVDVLVPSSLRPIPVDDLLPSASASGRVVVLEEGPRDGGWGAHVAAELSERLFRRLKAPVVRLGAKDSPIPNARPLEDQVLPSGAEVLAAVTALASRS